ncbi:TPA: hypothetical protein GE411_04270 [Escherichia coli]|nr:hypothetical protein [Escherichia coli]
MTEKKSGEGKAKGGIARAKSLTKEQRSEIAKKAAAARWKSKILRATHRGNFLDDFGIDAECYVLDDESKTVVVTKTGLSQLLGIGEHARDLDQLLGAQYMSKYRDLELQRKMENPYKFQLTSKSKTVQQAKAMITMWSSLKSHFGCSYKEISEEQFTEALSLAARVPLEGEFIGKQEKKTNELSAKEANSLVWLWDYANRSQALFRELYPALKQIQSNYSGRCYDYGHEFSYVIGMARDVLINHTRDVDINEPEGPTNLSAWMRLKNKELPPSVHNY